MVVHKGVGHYGAPITLNQAKKVMAAAEAKAKQNNWSVAVSIVDSGGHAVMLHRLDGTQLASIRIAEGKARTAVEFRRPTKALEEHLPGHLPVSPFEPPATAALFSSPVRLSILSSTSCLVALGCSGACDRALAVERGQLRVGPPCDLVSRRGAPDNGGGAAGRES